MTNKLEFYLGILKRFFLILFLRDKSIELFYLKYSTEYLFDNSYIIIRYRFKNAIWYRFGEHSTAEDHFTILDIKNNDPNLNLIVYGFFCKKKYQIKIEPNLRFNNLNFKAKVLGLEPDLILHKVPAGFSSRINIMDKIIETSFVKRRINNKPIELKTNQYNLNDFI